MIQQRIEVPLFLSHVGTQACTAVHFKRHIEQIPAITYGRLWFNFTDQDACTFFGRVLKPIDMPLAFDDVQVGKAFSRNIGIKTLVVAFDGVVNMPIENGSGADPQYLLTQT